MGKCLVTKLSGSVNNSSLLRIGEYRIKKQKVVSPTKDTQSFNIGVKFDTDINIMGNGFFTNENLSENQGASLKRTNSSVGSLYVNNADDINISVLNKYNIESLVCSSSSFTFDIDELKYSKYLSYLYLFDNCAKGDISSLKNCYALGNLIINSSTNIYGDIASLRKLTSLTKINLYGAKLNGSLDSLSTLTKLTELNLFNAAGSDIYGDIASLKGLLDLATINLYGTKVNGKLDSLSTLTKLNNIVIQNLSGSIDSLRNLSKLVYLSINGGTFTGDLALLPSTCNFVSFNGDNGSILSWSSRSPSAKILTIEGFPNITNIDKALQDEANCTAPDSVSRKVIEIKGSRTSASDAAVQTLQSKGYTVSITPA